MLNRVAALVLLAGSLGAAALCSSPARADEGMWLINRPPIDQLKAKHNFTPTPELLGRIQRACINWGGGSGSFVSPNGLAMTNHHVGSDTLGDLSTPERNLQETGFYAPTQDQELKCPGVELRVLMGIEDVTARVNEGITPDMPSAAAGAKRRANMSAIEKADNDQSKLSATVVTLYQGGAYHLYRYKTFTDVRLVFAPEQSIAFFGGDTDNFEFPRFNLDCCFFRLYENGKPFNSTDYVKFSSGAKENDLALVFGHPGRTDRLLTVSDLRFVRDVAMPNRLAYLWRTEIKLQSFAGRSKEFARMSNELAHGISNSRKALTGQMSGLHDPALMKAKSDEESRLRKAVESNAEWRKDWGDAWDRIATAKETHGEIFRELQLIGTPRGGGLLSDGMILLRMGEELKKPSGERLREFRDSNLASVKQSLSSTAPMYDEFEIEQLTNYFSLLLERFGEGQDDEPDGFFAQLLGGKSPRARAEEIVRGTKLKTGPARAAFAKLSGEEMAQAKDPLIELCRIIDVPSRLVREIYDNEIEPVEREAYAKIAAARFAIDGDKTYPDATGTLRMSFGPIKGYVESGKPIPAFTTIGGLYTRFAERKGQEGFELDQRWLDAKDKLDLATPFNFVCTADIIGGNSGSPALNTSGEVIGLIFDGNIQSLPNAYSYEDTQARALCVDVRAIVEALKKVYKADALVKELTGN